jgi:rhodanese-related sulfurtransferase
VLTGDTLFVGVVEVWPGHLGGSMCGGPGDLPERADDVQILDVRERSEWDEGHIPGSVFTPWHDIDGLPEGLDPDHPIAVVCGSGQRAAVGASLIPHNGGTAIHVIDGGVPAWGRLGHPLERQLYFLSTLFLRARRANVNCAGWGSGRTGRAADFGRRRVLVGQDTTRTGHLSCPGVLRRPRGRIR